MEPQFDSVLGVETVGLQGHPFLGRLASQIILGQVRPVDRPGAVAAEHDEASLIAFAAQSLRRGKTCGTAADDYNSARCVLRSAARFVGRQLSSFPPDDLA